MGYLHYRTSDGVGGWAEEGVDSGLFSRALMQHTKSFCEAELQRFPSQTVDPFIAVREGLHTMPFLRGSATATVVTLGRDNANLRVFNIGDSGAQVWRWDPEGALDPLLPRRRGSSNAVFPPVGAWRLIFQTEAQQTSFNAPLQIAKEAAFSSDIRLGVGSTFDVQPGDLVLVTTDGLLDNLWPPDVQRVLGQFDFRPCGLPAHGGAASDAKTGNVSTSTLSSTGDIASLSETACATLLGGIAAQLAVKSHAVGENTRASSPFAVHAQEAGHRWHGGKMDDVVVVLGLVVKDGANN